MSRRAECGSLRDVNLALKRSVPKVAILTSASGVYKAYIPLFKYCAQRAYPNYTIEIMLPPDGMPKYAAASYRHLATVTGNYDYVWITDIDIMVMEESVDLLSFHLREMKQSGLPYSNAIMGRCRDHHKRLRGLNFVNAQWYAKTLNARRKYMHKLAAGEIGHGHYDDEMAIRSVVEESGLKVSRNYSPGQVRHHGIHLGEIRKRKDKGDAVIFKRLSAMIKPEFYRQWNHVSEHPVFKRMVAEAGEEYHEIPYQVDTVSRFIRRQLRG